MFREEDLIYSYTRQQAIEDGVLVDVQDMAKEAGFRFHTVVTRMVWDRCVQVPVGLEGLQDEQGRLWDVLWMASLAARRAASKEDLIPFTVSVVVGTRRDGSLRRKNHKLWLHVGPGDTREPVLTIMFPEDY